MLETITDWILLYQDLAPYIVFGLLVLAGCSVPISEDLLIIASGVLAGSSLPEKTMALFIASFLGSYLSDALAYGIGRYIASRAEKNGRCCGIAFSSDFRNRFAQYFEKWGSLTLVIGRMIPFGFRNGIFMTAGAGRMSFSRFLISDGISCLLFSTVVFWLSFHAGSHAGSSAGANIELWLSRIGIGALLLFGVAAPYLFFGRLRAKKA